MFKRIRRVSRKSIALGLIFALSGAVSPAHAADAFSFVGKSQPGEFFFAVSEGSDFFISSLAIQPEGRGSDSFVSLNNPSTLEIEINGKKKVERFDACDPYQLMADAFVRHVRGKKDWVMPLEESLRFAELFDDAFALMGKPNGKGN